MPRQIQSEFESEIGVVSRLQIIAAAGGVTIVSDDVDGLPNSLHISNMAHLDGLVGLLRAAQKTVTRIRKNRGD